MQGNDSTYLKVSACLKHFAAYSQETGRVGFAAQVEARDMEDTYLPAFEAGVRHGRASGIMCSYTAETYGYGMLGNGSAEQHGAIPSCANKYLMTDLARDAWAFDGYITSDCGAADYAHGAHRYGNSTFFTAWAELSAGMDVDCGSDTGILSNSSVISWLTNASTAPSLIPLVDAALTRLFKVQMRLGQFDPPSRLPWSGYSRATSVNTPAHIALAKDAARQGFVLLKNANQTLPFARNGTTRLAVVGPHADATVAMLGNYHGGTPFLISPCQGLGRHANASCVVPSGCRVTGGSCFDATVASAIARADKVIIVAGIDGSVEAEGLDKVTLRLPGNQTGDITRIVAAAAGKPVVLLVMCGSPVDLHFAASNSGVSAIAWVGYPGQSGGDAIAEALFGAGSARSGQGTWGTWGKLPMTWYAEDYLGQVNLSDYRMRPDVPTGYPGRTHRFFTGTPRYPFGFGLTYATFSTSLEPLGERGSCESEECAVEVMASRGNDDDVLATFRVETTNTGSEDGDQIILLFLIPPEGAVRQGAPQQQLAAFERIHVPAGDVVSRVMSVARRHFHVPDAALEAAGASPWHVRVGEGHDAHSVRLHVRYH